MKIPNSTPKEIVAEYELWKKEEPNGSLHRIYEKLTFHGYMLEVWTQLDDYKKKKNKAPEALLKEATSFEAYEPEHKKLFRYKALIAVINDLAISAHSAGERHDNASKFDKNAQDLIDSGNSFIASFDKLINNHPSIIDSLKHAHSTHDKYIAYIKLNIADEPEPNPTFSPITLRIEELLSEVNAKRETLNKSTNIKRNTGSTDERSCHIRLCKYFFNTFGNPAQKSVAGITNAIIGEFTEEAFVMDIVEKKVSRTWAANR